MKTLNPRSIQPLSSVYKANDPIKEMLGQSFDRYNKIRDGVILCFKDYNIPPIMAYRIANELDFLAMSEYQQFLINYADKLIQGEIEERTINWDAWTKVFEGIEKIDDCWKKILDIFRIENVKVMEISRIAPEIRTTAMEHFINALGVFIEEKTKKPEEEKTV